MYPIAKDEEAVAATPSAAAAQTARQASNAEASSMGSWELVDADADVEADAAANQAGGGMVVPFPGGSGMDEEEGQSVWARGDDIEASEEENRKAKEVADVRRRREREEAEFLAHGVRCVALSLSFSQETPHAILNSSLGGNFRPAVSEDYARLRRWLHRPLVFGIYPLSGPHASLM